MKSTFSSVYFQEQATEADLVKQLSKISNENTKSVIVLIASQANIELASIPKLNKVFSFPIYASITPGVIYSNQYSYRGIIVIGFSQPISALLISDLNDEPKNIDQALNDFIECYGESGATMAFIDGLSNNVEFFIRRLYEQFGDQRSVIGAGMGALDFKPGACIADANGCYANAALVLSISNDMRQPMVSAHGWQEIAGPFLITSASENNIIELNYSSPFSVYQQALKEYDNVIVTPENFSNVSQLFPLGLRQLESECLVRDPARLEGDTFFCIGNVEENSLAYILHSEKDGLIAAAKQAACTMKSVIEELNYLEPVDRHHCVLAIDCISRSLFLGDDFQQELDTIKENLPLDTALIGLLSIGEIKSTEQGAIQLLNKTLVLGAL